MDKPANRFYGEQRVEIKPGWYGSVEVTHISIPYAGIKVMSGAFGTDELREMTHFLNQLAEYLENNH